MARNHRLWDNASRRGTLCPVRHPVRAAVGALLPLVAMTALTACAGNSSAPAADQSPGTESTQSDPPGLGTDPGADPSTEPSGEPEPAPVVVLDPGHNGGSAAHPEIVNRQVPDGTGGTKPCNTTGTQTNDGYTEHEFTFDVATRVRDLLTDQGIEVRLTRPDDTGAGPCVNERAERGNGDDVSAVVSIHADGSGPSGHGFHVMTAAGDPAGPEVAAESRRLAESVHDAYRASAGFTPSTYLGADGYLERTDLAGLNLSVRPTVMLETGNMRNADDAARMKSPDGRAGIAEGIAAGITGYLRP